MDIRTELKQIEKTLNLDFHVANKILNLSSQQLFDKDLPSILDYLAKHPEIKEVDFSFNLLGPISAKYFAEKNRTVTKVSFRMNPLKDEGIRDFTKLNTVVTKADFCNTELTSEGIKVFVRNNRAITHVDFSWNMSITNSGAEALLEDKLLIRISIDNFSIDENIKIKLANLMKTRAHLDIEESHPLTDYNQNVLIEKINKFLLQKKRAPLDPGYCSGLTLLWLYKMKEQQEQWFYNLMKKIINRPDNQLLDIEIDIEKLIAHIEWAQNSRKYTQHGRVQIGTQFFHLPGSVVSQRDMDKIFELEKIFSDAKYDEEGKAYSAESLKRLFNIYLNHNVMVRIAANQHAIGLFRRDLNYFIYDANYNSGEAKSFHISEFKEIYAEIASCLSINTKENPKLKLKIDMARSPRIKNQRSLIESKDDIEEAPAKQLRF